MDSKIKTCVAVLNLEKQSKKLTGSRLRGFAGYFFLEDPEFHHHGENPYHYPLIQYKIIDKKPVIVGIQEYADILMKKVSGMEIITLPGFTAKVCDVDLRIIVTELKAERTFYEFLTPWIALNEKNYKTYKEAGANDKKILLEKILIGNVLSALKGMGIFIDQKLSAELIDHREVPVKAHNNFFKGFKGNFALNILLPDMIGLGKSVSKGFGTIRRIR